MVWGGLGEGVDRVGSSWEGGGGGGGGGSSVCYGNPNGIVWRGVLCLLW